MFDHLGRAVARRPRLTVALWIIVAVAGYSLAVFGWHGESLFSRLETGAPTVPGSQSEQANQIMADNSTQGASLTLLVQGVAPDDADVQQLLGPVRQDLAAIDGVVAVIDPMVLPGGLGNPAAAPLVAVGGDGFLLLVDTDPALDDDADTATLTAATERMLQAADEIEQAVPDTRAVVGGDSLIVDEIVHQVEADLVTGEAIALPVALLVMVLVFAGFLAAAMPMVGAVASIGSGLGVLLGLSYVMTLESHVVNIVTILALGLSIDYGLLIVSRFREELHRLVDDDQGASVRRRRGDGAVQQALRTTMSTAGRTVAFSAVTVAIAVSGLMAFRPTILRAFGVAGVATVLIAVLTALTLVPALLTLGGRRLVKPGLLDRIPGLRQVTRRTSDVQREQGLFSALAGRVQRHPWLVLLGVTALLVFLATPLARLEMRNSTLELLPASSSQREFVQLLAEHYPGSTYPQVTVVAEGDVAELTDWATELAAVDGVDSVDQLTPLGGYAVAGVRVVADDPNGPEVRAVVQAIRDLDTGVPTWVTGAAAMQMDFTHAMAVGAPWAAGIVILATFLLLFLMTGSLLVPLKALLINTVSLAASLGVLVWAFQDGHMEGLLGFTSVGGLETYVVVLVIAFGFGLAMDYEVFLLSRIKELYDAGASNDDAVRLGLQRSGRIITSAAAIIIVVFVGFIFGELLVIKEVGFALAVAVFIDATLVRMLLVPATMTLLGNWNWWAPAPLRKLYQRFAITH